MLFICEYQIEALCEPKFRTWHLFCMYREAGRSTRMVMLVESDIELVNIYRKLIDDATLGFKVLGYYNDNQIEAIEKVERGENKPVGTEEPEAEGLH